jgi:beta-phosphoglucomutase-like phosphatase (HAD superfamily)
MISKLNRAFIFDLDGVITETSEYHFMAWKTVCKKLDMILLGKRMKN